MCTYPQISTEMPPKNGGVRKAQRKGFFQSAMFLASALKRGRHPPESILKFNIAGGECLSSGHLLRTWTPAILVKITLRLIPAEVRPLHVSTLCP
jgi:hypothetical protein